jgi:hypothetical protein
LPAGIVFGSLPSARSAAAPIDAELDKLMDRFFRDYIQMDPESALPVKFETFFRYFI